jgi:hypothetical protein
VILLAARALSFLVSLVILLILAAIALRVLDANASNSLVSAIHDGGRALVGPFHDVFQEHNPKVAIALNWGLAAFVYLIVGSFLVRTIARMGIATRLAGRD